MEREKQFVNLLPHIVANLDVRSLLSLMLCSRSTLSFFGQKSNFLAFKNRFSGANEIGEFEYEKKDSIDNGKRLIRGLIQHYENYSAALTKVGGSKGLRIDSIIQVTPFFENVDKVENDEIFYDVLEHRKKDIEAPEFCFLVVKNYFQRENTERKEIDNGNELDIEPLQLTLHEYQWGAHNPIGFRARDVEVISSFFLRPYEKVSRFNNEYFTRYISCGDLDFFKKLDELREKAATSSLMQCLTPSVIWIGGQRRQDLSRGRGLSV